MNYSPKKINPTYETLHFEGIICEHEETLENGHKIMRKYIKYLHPRYRNSELEKCTVGDRVTTSFTNKKRKRTERQNDFYWLYLSLLVFSNPHTEASDWHHWAIGKFLAKGITEIMGDKVRKVKSTAKLTVLEFVEYIMRIEEETKIPCPDPAPFNLPLTEKEWLNLKDEQRKRYSRFKPVIKLKK